MKIFIKIALITIILLSGLVPEAECAVLDAQVIAKKIKHDITEQLKQQHDGRVEVEVASLPYQKFDLPDGKIDIRTDTDLNSLDSSIVRVNIYVNGIKAKTFGARVEIKIYDRVLVAQDWIRKGDTLKSIKAEEKNISSMVDVVLKKGFDTHKYLARRNIKPGEIINKNYIEKIPTIVKNSPVSLIFKTPYVSVTIPAIALTSGGMGDYIKVKNKAYKKNYIGKVIGKNIVLVHI